MEPIYWAGCIALGYLYGSVNFAIILSRVVFNQDIRTLGNLNPGTANVGRTYGAGWGAVVLFLDVSKGVLPMLLARQIAPPATAWLGQALMVAVGIAAFLGHCKPLYFGFRGGGGIATSIGVFVMLVPAEAVISLLLAAAIVALFVRGDHKYGPYVPIAFVILTPFVTLAAALLFDLRLFGTVFLGGHEWYVVAGAFVMSVTIAAVDLGHALHRMRSLTAGTDPTAGFVAGGDVVHGGPKPPAGE